MFCSGLWGSLPTGSNIFLHPKENSPDHRIDDLSCSSLRDPELPYSDCIKPAELQQTTRAVPLPRSGYPRLPA